MANRKAGSVRAALQMRDSAGWMKDGGAFFRRELMGQVWEMRVESRGSASVAQVALLLGVSVMTVHRWIADGELEASPPPELTARGMRRLIKLSHVRKFALDRGYFMGVPKT